MPEDGRSEVTLTAPFTTAGEVTLAHVHEPAPEDILLQAAVVGSGTATVHLSSTVDPDTGRRLSFFQSLTYKNSAPDLFGRTTPPGTGDRSVQNAPSESHRTSSSISVTSMAIP